MQTQVQTLRREQKLRVREGATEAEIQNQTWRQRGD
jgi:hypothetical protein